jgi:hypothetical protein
MLCSDAVNLNITMQGHTQLPRNGIIGKRESGKSHMTIRRLIGHNLNIAGRYVKPTPILFLI